MSAYVHYLVCYDIPADKTRKKFFEALKDLGLVPLQKSVFYGCLLPQEVKSLEQTSKKMLSSETDKCFWFACHLDIEGIKKCVGYKNLTFVEPDGHGFL
jgi:CRISPR-associated protein Cas2